MDELDDVKEIWVVLAYRTRLRCGEIMTLRGAVEHAAALVVTSMAAIMTDFYLGKAIDGLIVGYETAKTIVFEYQVTPIGGSDDDDDDDGQPAEDPGLPFFLCCLLWHECFSSA